LRELKKRFIYCSFKKEPMSRPFPLPAVQRAPQAILHQRALLELHGAGEGELAGLNREIRMKLSFLAGWLQGSFKVASVKHRVSRPDGEPVTREQEDFGKDHLQMEGSMFGVTEGTMIQINTHCSEEGVACCIVQPGMDHLFRIDFTSNSRPCDCSEDSRFFVDEYFEDGKLRVRVFHKGRKPEASSLVVSLTEGEDTFHLEGEGGLVWGGSREWELEGVDLLATFTIRANMLG
jgi:hypothetical protein